MLDDKIMLGDFIFKMRKEKDSSQAQLGELVGVSNKAVSKWETWEANPELSILPKLAEVFEITIDELLACKKNDPIENDEKVEYFCSVKGTITKEDGSFEFVSEKKNKKGKPYVHVNVGLDKDGKLRRANGVLAIGLIAKGTLSIGLVSLGVLSIGLLSVGIVALGVLCMGLLVSLGASGSWRGRLSGWNCCRHARSWRNCRWSYVRWRAFCRSVGAYGRVW